MHQSKVIEPVQLPQWLKSRQPTPQQAKLRLVNVTRGGVIATSVEVAEGAAARSRGLLGREGLASGEGLWIIPCEAIHTFGMKFSIDLIYLDRQCRVKKIRRNVPPWRLSACLSAHSVIELAASSVREDDLRPGDIVELLSSDSIATTT